MVVEEGFVVYDVEKAEEASAISFVEICHYVCVLQKNLTCLVV